MKKIATLCIIFSASYVMADPHCSQQIALSYDDVLLVPQHSSIQSRRDVSTQTKLTKNIQLNTPLISSNMDSVTESNMAIAMALLGGIGIIHRFNTIDEQVAEVEKVKRYCNAVIEKPATISHNATLGQAKDRMRVEQTSGLLVVDESNKLVGILTARDVRFRPNNQTSVKELMTPRNRLIVGTPETTRQEAKQLLIEHRIEKLPLVHHNDTIAGLITGRDIHHKTAYPYSSVDRKDRLLVGAAIGVKEDSLARARALVKAGVDVLVIDIAHGHSELAIDTLKRVKKELPNIDVIAGNVATAHGVHDLIIAGADAIKVGVGPGSICTTRIVTGCGYPQLSALIECSNEAHQYGVPIIADGGIKQSGDITKAIAAGASTVMLGSLLAGTDESPGLPFMKHGKKFKVIRGMASFGAKLGRESKGDTSSDTGYVPEGVEATVPYKGSVVEIIFQLIGGLRSGMSYCGAHTIEELCGNGEFIRITSSGIRESNAHDVNVI